MQFNSNLSWCKIMYNVPEQKQFDNTFYCNYVSLHLKQCGQLHGALFSDFDILI